MFAKLCKVVFIVDGETVKESTEQAGKTVRAPKNPTKEGFIFKHWSKTVDGKDNSDELQEIKDDLTLYAVFEKEPEVIITHTVKFFANGKEIANKKVNDGNTVDPPTAPKKDGFLFRYWGLSENGNEVNLDTYAIKEDTDIYAIYEKEIEYFSVKFYSDGALFFEENNVAQGSAVPLPSVNPEKEGHSFQYWSKSEKGSAVDFNNYTVEQNETFYAVYEKNTVYYSVKFYSDGEIYFENSVAEGTTAVAPENNPEKDGHSFKYWSKAENGSAVSVNSYAVNEDTVFYAVFEKEVIIIKYQIRFYNDTELLKTETVVAGETATPPADPEREKFDFLYWSDAPDGDEFNVSGYAVDDDKDFYAVFRRKENPNDPEIINALKKALQDVSNIKLVDKEEKQVRSIMKQVLNDIIAKSETTLIDKNFVKTEYKTQIDQIKSIVKGWDNNKRSRFITTVSNEVDADTMDILMDYFLDGADVSQYLN